MSYQVIEQQKRADADAFDDGWNEEPAVDSGDTDEGQGAVEPDGAKSTEQEPQEPEAGQRRDAQPDPGQDSGSLDDEERRRQANKDSMQGRLEAERRKNRELEERLRTLESRIGASQTQHAQADNTTGLPQADTGELYAAPISQDSVDEETKELVETFAKSEPLLVKLVVEDSKDGARLRRILSEFGPDYTATAAESVLQRRQVAKSESERTARAEEAIVKAHYTTLATNHPEFKDAFIGTTDEAREAYSKLLSDLNGWVKTLSYEDGVYASNVLKGGTTDQVSFVIGKFKESRAAKPAPVQSDAVRKAAEAGMAVRTRSAPAIPKAQPDKNKWDDSIWE